MQDCYLSLSPAPPTFLCYKLFFSSCLIFLNDSLYTNLPMMKQNTLTMGSPVGLQSDWFGFSSFFA